MSTLPQCAREFTETHPDEAARLFEQRPAANTIRFLGELPAKTVAALFSRMSPIAAAESLALLSPELTAAVGSELPSGNIALLLRRLDTERRGTVLESLSRELRDQLSRLLEYPDGTVGAETDPDALTIPSAVTVQEAQRLVRRRKSSFHHQLYVVDKEQRLVGFLHVRDLIRASPKEPITTVMRAATVQLQARARLATSLAHPAWNHLDAIPVVDRHGVLIGILRHRRLRRLQAARHGGDVTSTLFGLSELYWMGLSTLMLPVRSAPSLRDTGWEPKAGGKHGD